MKIAKRFNRKVVAAAFLAVVLLSSAGVSTANAAPGLTPVFRLYNNKAIQHLMTIDSNENSTLLQNHDWSGETVSFQAYAPDAGACATGTEPVYRIVNKQSGEHLLTADTYERNFWTVTNNTWYDEGIGFCVYDSQVAETSPVYRLYNSQNGEHLLTADPYEVANLNGHFNWSLETNGNGGIAFYANR